MKHLILCVNYNNDRESLSFAKSVLNQPNFKGLVYIISCSKIKKNSQLNNKANSRIKIIETQNNIGYFGGASYGLKKYLSKSRLPDWVIVSNTDIKFADKKFFKTLDKIRKCNNSAIFAPDIHLHQKSWTASTLTKQNPAMLQRPGLAKMLLLLGISKWKLTYIAYEFYTELRMGLYNKIFEKKKNNTKIGRNIYAAFGACIIFHKTYFMQGGDLDFKSFLFGEEIYVAERALQLSLQTYFEPRLRLIHQEHSATSVLGAARRQINVYNSLKYLVKNFFI